ncbi:hypothetical protein [uncultured Parolsenella sp.]|uniref:hypothetical protein n=1 Tax=uncultured Parolsenella sp. TaxID=2083008 RepID=UPI0025D10605|nr:hypothetical protein [uncultured Parolsenella sp.]
MGSDEELGQSTVEYAIVLAAFLAAVIALGAMWRIAHEGGFQRLGEKAASHVVSADGMRDIVLF